MASVDMESPSSDSPSHQEEFVKIVNEMTESIKATHKVIRSILAKHQDDPESLDVKEGISLLTMKNHTMMSYLQSLIMLSTHRILGHSLLERTPPPQPFSSTSRSARGHEAGDLVDSLVEGRAVLEKAKALESKMKYQIEKLVRLARDDDKAAEKGGIADPLVFKPNPDNLVESGRRRVPEDAEGASDDDSRDKNGIYRPPQIAPVPYDEDSGKRKKRRDGPAPSALASLANYDPSNPYMESTTGLGNDRSVMTKRQRELADMLRFEEDNMTRLVLKKSEARRRERDMQDLALGGTGNTGRFGHAGDFEREFEDVLKSIDRSRSSKVGDGYESLRIKGQKASALDRSRGETRKRDNDLDFGDDGEDTRWKKKGRVEHKKGGRGGRGRGRGRGRR